MKSVARLLALAVLAAAAGCPSTTPVPSAGTAVISGAITTNPGGVPVSLGATYSTAGLRFVIQSTDGEYPALAFFAELPGTTLQAITYDATNASGASTLVQEAPTGGVSWTQVSAQDGGVGSFSLALTAVCDAVSADGGTSWPAPQGSLLATLVPIGTLTDAGVSVAVSFPTAPVSCPTAP